MKEKNLKNVGASVRRRLLNLARQETRPFQELLQYYAMERFLFRMSVSPYADLFVLKGAMLLKVWQAPLARPTMDIDMLGRTSNDAQHIMGIMRHIVADNSQNDGITFDSASLSSEPITEDADYSGVRIRFRGELDGARIIMQVDIGFGDTVYPDPEVRSLPSLLGFPEPNLSCYSLESLIAEKFEVMAKLGILNSRMKDFYDIWLLSRQYAFDGALLLEAIRRTFGQRGTSLIQPDLIFNGEFVEVKSVQWVAFRKRLGLTYVPERFDEVVEQVIAYLSPVSGALLGDKVFRQGWIPPDTWT
ncbi:nucleotidyl transferase AbiEii/AbiGii toxin family protein [Chlorobium sp. N1]|nr:nucleotidyl transferase AbiEii/AbiGii toxin family protein [Chlorobium sp. N1]